MPSVTLSDENIETRLVTLDKSKKKSRDERFTKSRASTRPLPENRQYPNRIRELRLARNWLQDELAAMVGLTAAAVNRHERGNRDLDGWTIERYAIVFQVSPYALFVHPDEYIEYDAPLDKDDPTDA
jgi:ribosome-binding protein aMBF1 (putative translation factor)